MVEFWTAYVVIGLVMSSLVGIHALIRGRMRSDLFISLTIGGVFFWPVCLVMAYQIVRRELKRERE